MDVKLTCFFCFFIVTTLFMKLSALETPYRLIIGNPDDVKHFRIGNCTESPCEIIENERYPLEMTLTMSDNVETIKIKAQIRELQDNGQESDLCLLNFEPDFCKSLKNGSCPLKQSDIVIYRKSFSSTVSFWKISKGYDTSIVRLYVTLFKNKLRTILYKFKVDIKFIECWSCHEWLKNL